MEEKEIIRMNLKRIKQAKDNREGYRETNNPTKSCFFSLVFQKDGLRRMTKRVRIEGAIGIIHRLRDRPSAKTIPDLLKANAISLYQEKYQDFGPTLANEKLFEINKIEISTSTLRNWLIEEHLWKKHRKRRQHRHRRERKECFGQMIQMDGSHHDWLEGRGPKLVIMGYIDDATGNVFARFYNYEGTIPAMDSFKQYVEEYGIPQSLYVDKHSTYKSTGKLYIEEELEGKREPKSQFERALEELVVRAIHANSPIRL